MSEEERVQLKKYEKEIKKQEMRRWIDKNWTFVIEGWNLSFILCVISAGIYSWNLDKGTFAFSSFLKKITTIGIFFIIFLAFLLLILMLFAKRKREVIYFIAMGLISIDMILTSNESNKGSALIASYLLNIFIGIWYCYLRYENKIELKNRESVKNFISFLMPIITTVISSLLK